LIDDFMKLTFWLVIIIYFIDYNDNVMRKNVFAIVWQTVLSCRRNAEVSFTTQWINTNWW